jgi:siroheme synthase
MTLDDVVNTIEQAEKEGKMTVRLHTGDPSVYGAIQEQMDAFRKKNIDFDIVPGVSSCFAAAAAFLCLFLAAGITFRIYSAPEPSVSGVISDPVLACQEAGKALEQLVGNLERGLSLIDYTRMHE